MHERTRTVEETLEYERYLLHTLMDNLPDNMYFKDTASRFVRINKALTTYFGLTDPVQAIGKTDFDFFKEEYARSRYADEQAIIRSGQPVVGKEEKELWLDGRVRWVSTTKMPFRDKDGKIIGTFGVSRDITDFKRTEDELSQAHASLDLAVRGSNIGILEAEMPDGVLENARLTVTNLWEMLGYDRMEGPTTFAGRIALVHTDDQTRFQHAIQSYLSGDSGEFEVEHRNQHKDGSHRWLLTRGVAVRDSAGRPVRFVASSVDITDLKRAEEALRESEERMRSVVNHVVDGIITIDEHGKVMTFNPAAERIFDFAAQEVIGQNINMVMPEPYHSQHDGYLANYFRTGQAKIIGIGREVVGRRKDGSTFPMDLAISVFRLGEGQYFTGIVRDITERKRTEEELRRTKEAAETANRAKDEFLANVSHEIRTPMNAILGMTELVLDTALTDDQRRCLKTVKSGADNLLGMINDLLDFSKIEADKLELELADFSLRSVVGDTLRVLAIRAHKKGLELVSHVQGEVPDALIGDAGRLRQVLLNLVGNAIKFTEEGEVIVRVSIAACGLAPSDAKQQATVEVRFEVSDTGIGIAPDKQETIFRAFEQEDTSTTRKYGGTGLGLTIATRLVALMGGAIKVKSERSTSTRHGGSTFSFNAFFARQSQQPESVAPQPPPQLYNLPVLIVDDNATNRLILEEWLHGWQMEPTAVGDGMAAMDALWHRAANGRPFALVLLDARMPDTDGLTVAAMIQERAELAATRIILLTSGDRPGDSVRIRDLRIDAHMLKPVQQDELLETIYRVMSRSRGSASTTPWSPGILGGVKPVASATISAEKPLNILVAEDNELSAQVIEQLLIRQGHRVRLASNGREALVLSEGAGLDLMLLDVHMPELDGFQVVQAIREREQKTTEHLPVIALTARSRKEDRERCLTAGMDEFLTKPIRSADLWAAIDHVLGTRSLNHPLMPNLLDAPVLLAACGGDPTLLDKMCRSLQARVPEYLAAVRDALHERNAPRLREAAHRFCGLLSEFSTVAGDLAGSMEDLAASTQLENAGETFDQLESTARELVRQADGLSIEALQRLAGAPLS